MYVTAFIRRYPFAMSDDQAVCFDEAAPHFAGAGELLFTDTQWEYAASFRVDGKSGAMNLPLKAHCEGCNGWRHAKTMAVAQFRANDAGLFDMLGNVWEWVADCYLPTYSEFAPAQCDTRIARGGSWGDLPSDLRASNRSPVKFSERSNQLGFRIVENF